MVVALIIAGGSGNRMGQDIPKQFINVYDKPVIVYTLAAFQNHPSVDLIEVVCLDGWHEILWAYAKQFNITKLKWVVSGGATGQESICNGLQKLKKELLPEDIVMIHDANRPMVSAEIISNNLATFHKNGSAITAVQCVEAVLRSTDGVSSDAFIPREQIYRTQTPQTLTLGKLLWAHSEAKKRQITNATATCTLLQQLGEKVWFSKGSDENVKITTPDDLMIFKALLNTKRNSWLK